MEASDTIRYQTTFIEDPETADCIEKLQKMIKSVDPLVLQYQATPTPEHLECVLTAFGAFGFSVEDFEHLQRIGASIASITAEIIEIDTRLEFAEGQLKRVIQPNRVNETEVVTATCDQTFENLRGIVKILEVTTIKQVEPAEPTSAPLKRLVEAIDELNKKREWLETQHTALEKLDQFAIITAGLNVRIRKLTRNFQEDKRAYVLQRDQDKIIGCMWVFLNATENDATAAFFRLKPADRDSLIELHKKAVGLRAEFTEWEAQVSKAHDQLIAQRKAYYAHPADGHTVLAFAESAYCLGCYFTQKDLASAAATGKAGKSYPFADKTQTALKDVLAVRADEKFNRCIADLKQQIHAIEEKLGVKQVDAAPVDEKLPPKSKKIDALQLRTILIETCVLLGECDFFDEMLADQAESFTHTPDYQFLNKRTELTDAEEMTQGFKAFLEMGSVLEMMAAVSTDGHHSELYQQLQAIHEAFFKTIGIAQKEVIADYEFWRKKYFGTPAFLFNAKEKAYEKLKAAYDEAKPFQRYRTFIPVRSGDVHDVNEVGIADEIDNLDPKSLDDTLVAIESEINFFQSKPDKEKVKDKKNAHALQCLKCARVRLVERIEADTKEALAVLKGVTPHLDNMDIIASSLQIGTVEVNRFIDIWIKFADEDFFPTMMEWRKLDQRQFQKLFPRIAKPQYLTIARFRQRWEQLQSFATQIIVRLWLIISDYPKSKISILLMNDKEDTSHLAGAMARFFEVHPSLCKTVLGQEYGKFRATYDEAIQLPQHAFNWGLGINRLFDEVQVSYGEINYDDTETKRRFCEQYGELRALFSQEDIKRAQNIKVEQQCPNPICLNALLAVTNPEKIFPGITGILQEFGPAKK